MRIAQVAPLYESVPPRLYGGTERVVSYLTEELVRQGHAVTLYASGDSVTEAELAPCCELALRLDPRCTDPLARHIVMIEQVFQRADEFDVIHFHVDYLHFPISRRQSSCHVTTLHGRLDLPELAPLHREFSDPPVISISNDQRKPLSWINWQGTVYHGLPRQLHSPGDGSGGYLAFLGRISPEKGVERAIEIAKRAEMPLKIAAKVDRVDRDYYQSRVAPLLEHPLVEFIGEISEAEKGRFLGDARALLFPIDWPEPFGLVMIEALACGLPVVAWRRGSAPEVLEDGACGFIVDNVDEAVAAVGRIGELSRDRCRETFERRFSVSRMARDYVAIFERLLGLHLAGGRRNETHALRPGRAARSGLASPGRPPSAKRA